MSRSLKESVIGTARKSPPGLFPNGSFRNFNEDDNLNLFSKTRRPFSVTSAHHPDVPLKLGRLSIGSAKQGKSGLDDLLSADGGKHDYDWLLTPPGTPLVPSSNGNESQPGLLAPRSSPLVRSISTTKASRDLKNGSNLSRPLTGSNLFPQSIRSSNHNTQLGAASGNGCIPISRYSDVAESGNHINTFSASGSEEDKHPYSARLANSDIFESSRYNMILLKEDLKNMNWLHSIDDKADEGSIIDNGFVRLPEPFDHE